MGGQTHLPEPPGTFPLLVITALGLLTISALSPTPETLMQVVTRRLRQWHEKPEGFVTNPRKTWPQFAFAQPAAWATAPDDPAAPGEPDQGKQSCQELHMLWRRSCLQVLFAFEPPEDPDTILPLSQIRTRRLRGASRLDKVMKFATVSRKASSVPCPTDPLTRPFRDVTQDQDIIKMVHDVFQFPAPENSPVLAQGTWNPIRTWD